MLEQMVTKSKLLPRSTANDKIANIIGRKPDEDIATLGIPEVARSRWGIYIEPYLPQIKREQNMGKLLYQVKVE